MCLFFYYIKITNLEKKYRESEKDEFSKTTKILFTIFMASGWLSSKVKKIGKKKFIAKQINNIRLLKYIISLGIKPQLILLVQLGWKIKLL